MERTHRNALRWRSDLRRVLIIGFSVTEMPSSYPPRLQRLVAQRRGDVEVAFCGLGGVTIDALAYFVDHVIDAYPEYDHICYEVATGNGRFLYQENLRTYPGFFLEIWSWVEALVAKAHARHRSVSFVNFPRQDVNYASDIVEGVIAQFCALRRLPLLPLSYELLVQDITLESLLGDVVHPNPAGAELYAAKVFDFLSNLPDAPHAYPPQPQQRYGAISLPAALARISGTFRRRGFFADYAACEGGEEIVIQLPEPVTVDGVAALVGPRSGALTIVTDVVSEVMLYDEFCYYERMMPIMGGFGTAKDITLRVSPELPGITLLKGQPDLGPRKLGLIYLFTRSAD